MVSPCQGPTPAKTSAGAAVSTASSSLAGMCFSGWATIFSAYHAPLRWDSLMPRDEEETRKSPDAPSRTLADFHERSRTESSTEGR